MQRVVLKTHQKPEVPGKPIEPNVNIKKRIDNFGSFS